MNKSLPASLLLVWILVTHAPLRADGVPYTFYEIGDLGCPVFTEPRDVNDGGQVVGVTVAPDCVSDSRAFVWHNGIMTDLSDPVEGEVPWSGQGIAQDGVVLAIGGPERVLILRDGTSTQIGPPPGCDANENPLGINGSGTLAVGMCRLGGGDLLAALYRVEDTSAIMLGTIPQFPDDVDYEAYDVNDAGMVVGRVVISGAEGDRAFIWSEGVIEELVNVLGGTGANAYGINNAGLIVGNAETVDGFPAMSYDINTGVMSALGAGTAYDVNGRGEAVGRDIIDFVMVHPILYKDGQAIDLSAFLPTEFADDARAKAINNFGWIVGYAEDTDSNWHGFVLVPIYDKGDYDGDGDVDLQDSGHFQRCFAAEPYIDGTPHVGCSVFDFDDDVDLDLDDYAAFQSAFTGPTAPNNNPNGPG